MTDAKSRSPTPIDMEPKSYNVAGIHVNVWGMDRLSHDREVAAMFFLHGRTSSKDAVEKHVRRILPRLWKKTAPGVKCKDLLIITLDARNHGTRMVDPVSNESFDQNPRHAVDMYAIQTGTAVDVGHLSTFLPAYLFPDATNTGGSPITTWVCAGVSLGGHTTWLAGCKNPRISHLIPIIGSPDYAALLRARAAEHNLAFTAPHWPRALDALVRSCDPVNLPLDFWMGKRILAIGGGQDTLVPPGEGGTIKFIDALKAHGMGERVQLKIDDDAGHEVTPRMVGWMVEWLWENVLKED